MFDYLLPGELMEMTPWWTFGNVSRRTFRNVQLVKFWRCYPDEPLAAYQVNLWKRPRWTFGKAPRWTFENVLQMNRTSIFLMLLLVKQLVEIIESPGGGDVTRGNHEVHLENISKSWPEDLLGHHYKFAWMTSPKFHLRVVLKCSPGYLYKFTCGASSKVHLEVISKSSAGWQPKHFTWRA